MTETSTCPVCKGAGQLKTYLPKQGTNPFLPCPGCRGSGLRPVLDTRLPASPAHGHRQKDRDQAQ